MKQTKGDQIFLKILYRQTKRGLILMKLKNLQKVIIEFGEDQKQFEKH